MPVITIKLIKDKGMQLCEQCSELVNKLIINPEDDCVTINELFPRPTRIDKTTNLLVKCKIEEETINYSKIS